MSEVLRHEIKFCCGDRDLGNVYDWLFRSPGFIRRQHPNRQVNNIYFDSFDLRDASDNLIGLAQREKLRLRWYGDDREPVDFHLERKIKKGMLGYKRSRAVRPLSLEALSRSDLYLHLVNSDENSACLDMRLRNPVLRNSYLREYYVDRTGRIRVTIDRKQQFFSTDFSRDVFSGNRIDYPIVVVEVKYDEEDAALARHTIRGFPLRPNRHSKYLAGLARLMEHPYF